MVDGRFIEAADGKVEREKERVEERGKKGEKRVPKAAFDKGQAKQHLQLAPSAKLCFKKHPQQQQEKRESPMKETERKQGN